MKSFWILFFLGVAFEVVSGDISCFIEKQRPRILELWTNYGGFSVNFCRPARNYFISTQEDAKSCSLKRITVENALAFTKDFCTVGWDLNNQYLKHETCFGTYFGNARECIQHFNLPNKSEEVEYMKNVCSKLEDVYKCFNEKVGKPCGDEAVKLTTRFTGALSSYTKGVCIEVNATTFIKLQWNILLGLLILLTIWYKY